MAHIAYADRGSVFEAALAPGADEVQAQLDRIGSSPEFEVPERARRFLSYVVEEALAGRANRIKAYSIALEVFGRDASFDAQVDPVVRIEAGRIRRALQHYYLTAGQHDPVTIGIPKGGYVPTFVRRGDDKLAGEQAKAGPAEQRVEPRLPERALPERAWLTVAAATIVAIGLAVTYCLFARTNGDRDRMIAAASPNVPKLIVRAFDDLSGTDRSAIIARGLTEEVLGQIARLREITVFTNPPFLPAGAEDSRYQLEGAIRIEGDRLRLTARLVSRSDGSVVWSTICDEDLKVRGVLDIETNVAGAIAAALAEPYGVISRGDDRITKRPQTPDATRLYMHPVASSDIRRSDLGAGKIGRTRGTTAC